MRKAGDDTFVNLSISNRRIFTSATRCIIEIETCGYTNFFNFKPFKKKIKKNKRVAEPPQAKWGWLQAK